MSNQLPPRGQSAQRPFRPLCIPDAGRRVGINIVATRGTGKTRLLARVIAWQDFVRGIPLVLLDPLGAAIDNLLDKITRQPPGVQLALWRRVRLVDTAGVGGVTPTPLFLRRPGESLYSASQRLVDTLRRTDASLQTAPIQGWNALVRLGTATGMILLALGLQITEAESLIRTPEAWAARLRHLAATEPEAAPAVRFFLDEYLPQAPRERQLLAASFLAKIAMFQLDPTLTAMFGAGKSGLSWEAVVDKRVCLLVDFRHETHEEALRFKLVWLFRSLVDFIKARGPGRHTPLSLLFDEITFLLAPRAVNAELLTADLDELVNRLSRNNGVWLTAAYQELYQLPPAIQKTFLTLGTQLIGATTDKDAALLLARRFNRYAPYWVKKVEPVSTPTLGGARLSERRVVEFTHAEQDELNSRRYLDLPKFTFLVGCALDEGSVPTRLQRLSIARLDAGEYVNEPLVARARALLVARASRPAGEVLAEIAQRAATPQPLPATVSGPGVALPRRQSRRAEPLIRSDPERPA